MTEPLYNYQDQRNDTSINTGLQIPQEQMMMPQVSYGGGLAFQSIRPIVSQPNSQLDLEGMEPQRKKTSGVVQLGLGFSDLLNMSSGDPNAFIGQAYQKKLQYQALQDADDPEGKAADLNRAKLLSRKASQTDDESLKAVYGKAIKGLFPRETQGMDDVTASDLFMTDNDKLQLEMLKGQNALNKQALTNQGRLDNTSLRGVNAYNLAGLNNESREAIAGANVGAKMYVADKGVEGRLGVAQYANDAAKYRADASYRSAVDAASIGYNKATDVANINAGARLEQEGMRQSGQTQRTGMTTEAQRYAADQRNVGIGMQQQGALQRTLSSNQTKMAVGMMRPVGGGIGGKGGTAKERAAAEDLMFKMDNYDAYVGNQDEKIGQLDDMIKRLKDTPGATGPVNQYLNNFGLSSSRTQDNAGWLQGQATEQVLLIIQQLNEAGATSSVFNSEGEQKRMISEMTQEGIPYSKRLATIEQFRDRVARYFARERQKLNWQMGRQQGIIQQSTQQAPVNTGRAAETIVGGQDTGKGFRF